MFNIFKNKIVLTIAVVAFLTYFVMAMVDTGNAINESKEVLAEYKTAISQEEEIAESLDKEEENAGSDEHIEAVARERLGLCKSNEKIFVDGVGN